MGNCSQTLADKPKVANGICATNQRELGESGEVKYKLISLVLVDDPELVFFYGRYLGEATSNL